MFSTKLCILVGALAVMPAVSAQDIVADKNPSPNGWTCVELPCPDDCGLESLVEKAPTVVCFPTGEGASELGPQALSGVEPAH